MKFEARKSLEAKGWHEQFAALPTWDGEPLTSGRVLVYGEQGVGDEILFASMLRDVTEHVPHATLLCDPRLRSLFARSFPAAEVVATTRDMVPEVTKTADAAVAAGSLGMFFRRDHAAFPDRLGYLVPDPVGVSDWHERLHSQSPGRLNIGLSWRGGVLKTGRNLRSLSVEELRPLLDVPGISWISLQHGETEAEIAQLARTSGTVMRCFPDVTADIDNLAALISALDLEISVCNTNVHVAGALGKEVCVIAPFVPLWMYGMKGVRMPWYPSARIFRQASNRGWEPVVRTAALALSARLRDRAA